MRRGKPVAVATLYVDDAPSAMHDYLFRFDRGAFWMARHGLQMFWHCAAWATPSAAAGAGPWWLIRVTYAWLATTRQLYRMLHAVGDETLARVYIVQDFIMPSAPRLSTSPFLNSQMGLNVEPSLSMTSVFPVKHDVLRLLMLAMSTWTSGLFAPRVPASLSYPAS